MLRRVPRGLSLVEMMIGIAVGLFVLAGATLMLTNQLHDGRKLMLETQVQQDMRSAADIVARELRRANSSANAAQLAWYRGTTGVQQSGYSTIDRPADSRVEFRYGVDADNSFDVTNEQFAFWLEEDGAIYFQLRGGTPQALTDPATLTVRTFNIQEHAQAISLDEFCSQPCGGSGSATCGPQQIVRRYTIEIEAHATRDDTVQRSLRVEARPRNDVVTGACSGLPPVGSSAPTPAPPSPPTGGTS